MKNSSQSIKIIVLILSAAELPWSKIENEGQRVTFARKNTAMTSFFWIRGAKDANYSQRLRMSAWLLDRWYSLVLFFNRLGMKGPKSFPFASKISTYLSALGINNLNNLGVRCENSVISVPIPEHKSLIGLKTLLALDYALNNFAFDYVVRTNSSSFLDVKNMERVLVNSPRENYVAGFQGDFFGETFTSGAGYIMSKDVVKRLVSQGMDYWEHHVIDDVAFSRVIKRETAIKPQHIDRVTLTDIDDPFFKTTHDSTIFHYRCKTSNPETSITLMKKISQKISQPKK